MLDSSTHKTIKEPMGYFTDHKKLACPFRDKWQAEVVSAGYEGTHVEEIIGKCRVRRKKEVVK